ncbi:hypothetical protein [Streptomyces canus]|uniref:hypothetical protein n=1 Tax=Streptomyces canus TaxID=58343 RepID=UPI002E25C3BB
MTGSVRRDLPHRRTATVARSAGGFLVGGAFGGTAVSGAACCLDDVVEGVRGTVPDRVLCSPATNNAWWRTTRPTTASE